MKSVAIISSHHVKVDQIVGDEMRSYCITLSLLSAIHRASNHADRQRGGRRRAGVGGVRGGGGGVEGAYLDNVGGR